MSVSSLKLLVLMLLGAALLPGCSPGLGDFCFQDSDCSSGLRCTARDDQRGICTYPEGVLDQSVAADLDRDASTDRGPTLDLGPLDGGADLADGPDAIDRGTPDVRPDLPLTPDLSKESDDQGSDVLADSASKDASPE